MPPPAHALVPPAVTAYAARGPAWSAWVRALPRLLGDLLEEWSLRPDGAAGHGHTAVVVPVTAAHHPGPAVLKVGFVDDETRLESLALQHWAGDGAVRLLQADPRRGAMLLERLPGPHLTEEWDLTACEVVAGLYGRLHRPAPPQPRRLEDVVRRWLADLGDFPPGAPLPRRMLEQVRSSGAALCDDLAAARADDPGAGRLLHTDLHYDNVMAAGREPWLVIDPKPLSGDPHFEPAPMLWNRWEDVTAAPSVREAVRRRFHTLVDVAGLDEARARDWVVVRMVLNAAWEVRDAEAAGRRPDQEWLTRCVSIVKAVQE